MMNIMKFRPLFYFLSGFMLLVSCFSILKWGFKPSIDFAGGTVWEVKFDQNISRDVITKMFANSKIPLISVANSGKTYTIKF